MANNKYVSDIRRIVNVDPNQYSLGPADKKANIIGKRAISYRSADGSGSGAVSGSAGYSLGDLLRYGDLAYEDGLDEAGGLNDDDSAADKGNTVDPKSPHNSIYQGDQGTHDIEAVIDGEAGTPSLSNAIPNAITGSGSKPGGTLNGLTNLTDCESGGDLDLRMDGLLRPPPGWYSAGEPDTEINGPLGYLMWQPGVQWRGSSILQPISATALPAAEAARDEMGDGDKTDLVGSEFDGDFPHTGGVFRWIFTFRNPSTMAEASYYAFDVTCVPGSSGTCPLTNPVKWPADGKMQMIRNPDGSYTAASYENADDIIPKYTDDQHTQINFCFGVGRSGKLMPAANNGYLLGETLTEGGEYTGVVKLLNSENKVISYLTPTTYQSYLPKG
jgi:hypothetical protein